MMKRCIALILLVLSPLPALAAASFDTANVLSGQNYFGTSLAINVTVGANDNLLLVLVNSNYVSGGAVDPSPIAFNGTALTKVGSGACNTNWYQGIWYLANPPTGTHSLSLTYPITYNTTVVAMPVSGAAGTFGTPVFNCLTGTVTTAAATATGGGSNDIYFGGAYMDTTAISDAGSNMVNLSAVYNFSETSADYILGSNAGAFSWSGTGGGKTTSIGGAVAVLGSSPTSGVYFLHQ